MSQNEENRNRQDNSGRDSRIDEPWRESRGDSGDFRKEPSPDRQDQSSDLEDMDDLDEEDREDDDRIDGGQNRRRSIS